MAIIRILHYPDKLLQRKAKKVTEFDDKLQKIIDDMFETHYSQENCAALAATQLDIANAPHVTVIDFSDNKDEPLCLVNGEIIERSGEMHEFEGCMSVVGGIYEKVKRAAKIKVRAQDRYGKPMEFEATEFMAKCIQHELDHLDGVLFIDRLSSLKRHMVDKKVNKLRRLRRA